MPRLAPPPANRKIPDDELMRRLRDACVAAGGVLSQTQFDRSGRPRYGPYRRRWGRWPRVLAALRVWVAAHDPAFPHRDRLPRADVVPDPPLVPPAPGGDYGTPIAIPGLLHAPVDLAGVLLLFGLLARELGFVVAHVRGAHVREGEAPSCEAPSCEVRRRHGDVWERLRLVFAFASLDIKGHELKSRDIKTGALASGDLVVCWTHNWPDCPVEVIELKREVARRA